MIEMQMRVDDDVDVVGMVPIMAETFEQIRAFERVDVAKFVVVLVAGAGFDQDALAARVDEKRIHRHRDAIPRIRRSFLLPHRLGNHAEHRAAVESEAAGFDDVKFQFAQLQRLAPIPARARISFTAA